MRAIREMLKQNKKVGVVAANAGAMSMDSCFIGISILYRFESIVSVCTYV